jgi:hypothetical protein
MITQEQAIDLTLKLNQARQALGQYVSNDNEFAMQDDTEQFTALGKQFAKMGYDEFIKALKNAYRKKQDDHKQGKDGGKARLMVADIKDQCHTITAAMNAQAQANTPQLEAPKPILLEGEEWLDAHFRQAWENSKAFHTFIFTPIWSRQVFPSQSQVKAIAERLVKMPEFHEGRKDNARRMTLEQFHRDLEAEMKSKGFNELYSFTSPSDDYHTKTGRDSLNERIVRHNASKPSKIEFEAHEAYNRSKTIAMVKTYGYIMEELNWERKI